MSTHIYSGSSGEEERHSEYQGSVAQPINWTVIWGQRGRFVHTKARPSIFGGPNAAIENLVKDVGPRARRRRQAANRDWMITTPLLSW